MKLSSFLFYLLLTPYSLLLLLASNHPYPQSWNDLQNNEGWELIKEMDRVKIFGKQLEDSPLPSYKAEIISDVEMYLMADAAWLVENSTEIFPNAFIIDAGVYHRRSDTSYTAFQLFDIPFLSPRLYQFDSIRHGNNIHWVRTDTVSAGHNPENLLLPPVNFGSWEVEQVENQSKLTYRLCTNPGGNVPLWIVEQANQRYLPQMMLDIESFAREKK